MCVCVFGVMRMNQGKCEGELVLWENLILKQSVLR